MIVKIAVPAMFGLGAFALSQTLDAKTEGQTLLAIGTSVFVSGIAFVVQFLLDVEARIEALQDSMRQVEERYEHHSQEMARMTREQFEKINDATELFGAVEASALRIDPVTQLVRDATTVARTATRWSPGSPNPRSCDSRGTSRTSVSRPLSRTRARTGTGCWA